MRNNTPYKGRGSLLEYRCETCDQVAFGNLHLEIDCSRCNQEMLKIHNSPYTCPIGKTDMKYLSVCSGVEGASVAWHPLHWVPTAFAETDPFACALLQQRFPNVPNWGDMTNYESWPDADIDLLVGGTPCQGFSVAGLRGGLADWRSNLLLTFLLIAKRYKPRWIVWENVPGVFSSYTDVEKSEDPLGLGWEADQESDFGSVLQGMDELGYGVCWRVLDAQYTRVHGYPYAVPQRRRRVFVVGYLADWRRPAAVLLEPESMRGNPPSRRKAGESLAHPVAQSLTASGRGTDRPGEPRGQDSVIAQPVSGCVSSKWVKQSGGPAGDEAYNLVAHSLRAEGFDASEDGTGRGTPLVHESHSAEIGPANEPKSIINSDVADPVTANEGRTYTHEGKNNFRLHNVVAIQERAVAENPASGPDGIGVRDDDAYTLEARGPQAVAFSCKDGGGDAGDVSPTLRAMDFDASHANGGGQLAVAFQPRFVRNGRGAPDEVASALTAEPGSTGKGDSAQVVAYGLRSDAGREGSAKTPSLDAEGRSRLRDPGFNIYEELAPTLDATQPHTVAFDTTQITSPDNYSHPKVDDPSHPLAATGHPPAIASFTISKNANGYAWENQAYPTLQTHLQSPAANQFDGVREGYAVRRLTPRECERLQGFPDDWTLITYRGKPAADGPRYKALGNAFAVNCIRWIGYRIQSVENLGLRAHGGVFG